MSKHKKSPLDRFFLAVNWSEMRVDKRGIIHNARSHWCPLQVATRSSAGYYFLMARDRFKLTCREVQDIIRAADNSRAPTPQSREIRFKMLSLIEGATR